MNRDFLLRKKTAEDMLLKTDLANELYSNIAIFRIINGIDSEKAEENLIFSATWFEHEHPLGRDLQGEPDFVSISLISALHHCYDKISPKCRQAIDKFYLEQDYNSKYNSENHNLMFYVSRFLAAEFYRGAFFKQYGMTADEIIEKDGKYIDEFLMYRARASWGEFDSGGYAGEIMLILNILYTYTSNQRLKKKAEMMMDIILLDMIVDSKSGLCGGAHGRIYPPQALDSTNCTMYRIYCYYFGADEGMPFKTMNKTGILLSPYYPSEIVCRLAKNRKFPYENRERKHLHLYKAWREGIRYDQLEIIKDCSIDKYTYVSDDYILGCVNHQDKYPEVIKESWYAHHQQHEWELTLAGSEGRAKIFSHHPGETDQHNHWTGDMRCNCGTHFCTEDTAISMYNIVKEDELPYIHAYIPFDLCNKIAFDTNYIFLKYKELYIMVWFSGNYQIVTEGVLSNSTNEVKCDGRKNAFICRIESMCEYASFEEFIEEMKVLSIVFDTDNMSVEFNNIYVDYDKRLIGGKEQIFPYTKLFDSPYVKSEYYSAVYEVTDGNESKIYDFNF